MKNFKEKYSFYTLMLIIVAMTIGGWNTCQAQVEKQYPQKITLEMELEQIIKITIPKVEELNKIKQTYPPKGGSVNLKRKPTIPEVDAIIKEEDYNENNK